jgi:CDP-diacylglycerol--glycerol-3-phosphate 3-phosphatidyltransferase
MKYVPLLLTTIRLSLAPLLLVLAVWNPIQAAFLIILLLGLLTDIYDGVIARRLGVVTPALRTYDSLTDVTFYLAVCGAAEILHPRLIIDHALSLGIFLLSELGCNLLSLIRFKATPATHSYAAKFFGLTLYIGFSMILGFNLVSPTFTIITGIGTAVNLEIILILLLAQERPVDVKSVFMLNR